MSRCRFCGSTDHTGFRCPQRPVKYLKNKKPLKKKGKRANINKEVNSIWLENNPPDEYGKWECYLKISPNCYRYVTAETINIEHSYSKTRHTELRERQDLLHPACTACNEFKGSKDITDFVDEFPHLIKYVL